MDSNTKKTISAVVIILFLITAFSSLYIVRETEQAVITQFGKPVGEAVKEPGLKVKTPFIQKVNYFDKRWLEWDGDANQIPTRDKKYIWVNSYARWRIKDPLMFFQTVRDEMGAQTRLDDIIDGETRNAVANYHLIEIVRTSNKELNLEKINTNVVDTSKIDEEVKFGREAIIKEILRKSAVGAEEYGIEIVDIRVKRINYSEKVRSKVYDRMISERQRIAQRYRSEGSGKSEEIRGKKERMLKKIRSEAYRKSQEIKGEADAVAAEIYSAAHRRDPDFYAFMKTMETYGSTLDSNSLLLLSTDGELFKYLKY